VASIIVAGLPEGLLARLRLAAAGNGRSLEREVLVQLVRSVAFPGEAGIEGGARFRFPCTAEHGCRCAARRVEARAVGWGGPAQ
jgi:plasmid stability protein